VEINVTWIGERPEPAGLLAGIAAQLASVYEVRTAVRADGARPAATLDPRRGQHSSTAILHWLQAHTPVHGKLLAVTDADLFIPVLTFVYGEAQLGGRAAVVSLARLRDEAAPSLTATRMVKEAVHEVGHLFGLVHCDHPRCAMRRAAAARDVDAKVSRLCADCRLRLDEAAGSGRRLEAT
jgi:archaemetzincin